MTNDEVMLFEKNGTCPDFGYIRGNDRIVFVKVGLGGDHIVRVPDADHNFTGKTDAFIAFADRLMEG
jgi:hypothetical protein